MLRSGSIFLSGQPVSQGESSANASYVSRVPCGRFFIRRQGVGVMGGVGGGGGLNAGCMFLSCGQCREDTAGACLSLTCRSSSE